MDRNRVTCNAGGVKDLKTRTENIVPRFLKKGGSIALFQKFRSLFSCDDRGPFDANPLDQEEEISGLRPAGCDKPLFFNLPDHISGKDHLIDSGSDLRMSADDRNIELPAGIVDLVKDPFNEPRARAFHRKEKGNHEPFWNGSPCRNIVHVHNDAIVPDFFGGKGNRIGCDHPVKVGRLPRVDHGCILTNLWAENDPGIRSPMFS